MKETRLMMGMPITVEIIDNDATTVDLQKVFDYFNYVEEKFSLFKKTSEITKINAGEINPKEYSDDMKKIFTASEETKKLTNGYFNIEKHDGTYDTSGIVKGWAIYNAAELLKKAGFKNYYVEAGGDIQVHGNNDKGEPWSIGIRDPFDKTGLRIIKVVYLANNEGIATSGTYLRGQHIYNPHDVEQKHITDIVSLTVIGQNIYEADRFATAAFAMGKNGISFIENLSGFEGYIIDKNGIATFTSSFEKYLEKNTKVNSLLKRFKSYLTQ